MSTTHLTDAAEYIDLARGDYAKGLNFQAIAAASIAQALLALHAVTEPIAYAVQLPVPPESASGDSGGLDLNECGGEALPERDYFA